ncbi:hypothetical protein MBM_02967 [Drepanopeziza brunnea f. sp. 'multigermtubi' MB_m1]|uniref:Uncharacterized protein n=1 Tax=Marssonina brunnea f. sp. multigermtubi (strain MB_m1) TaxID=1072389 RepID=K1WM01_MARBU|nr:uncharacterized protein MBM_02967 [Drepanopeziza brunnea f. sp. 'multigermtubi' MB_m1]EKD18725.1 hypothetical protein MBM_02967 [Drepanopeziza brunnea f. sp. 'multigermtubi' MB_m1]
MASSTDADLRLLTFLPRPKADSTDSAARCQARGIPAYKSELQDASEKGIFYLALAVLDAHNAHCNTAVGSFGSRSDVLPKIMTILCSLAPSTITALINGESHKLFDPRLAASYKLPAQHYTPAFGIGGIEEELPVIYLMAACNKSGLPPTIANIESCVTAMRNYGTILPSGDAGWKALDDEALKIDNHKGYSFSSEETGWTPTQAQQKTWLQAKDKSLIPHPRRFRATIRNGISIESFCSAIESRTRQLANGPLYMGSKDQTLLWTPTSVGYSRKPARRKQQHSSHYGTDSRVKNVGEHTISILDGSYVQWGGLNSTAAGGGGMDTSLRAAASDNMWKTAVTGLIKQDVFLSNAAAIHKRLEMDKFLRAFRDEGSELTELLQLRKENAEAKQKLNEAQKELVVKCHATLLFKLESMAE